jgi:sugar/nucleoside kinase (ribokinase family)
MNARFDIVTVGTATIDVVGKLASTRSSSAKLIKGRQCFPLGAKLEINDFCVASGGGATNTAVTFSRQGLKTAAVFEAGNDVLGDYLIKELRKEKVVVYSSQNKKLPTAGSVILVDSSGERTVFVHRGAANDLTLKEIPLSSIKSKWLYLVPGGIGVKTVLHLIKYAKSRGIKIALNPSEHLICSKTDLVCDILSKADMLLVNREEAAALSGLPRYQESAVFKKLDRLVKGILVVTYGNRGAKVSDGRQWWSAGSFKNKKVVDRLGAGDAFGSGFVAGLIKMNESCTKGVCHSRAIEYAIRLGSANATSVVEALGAKAGILTSRDFKTNKRWQNLKITVTTIS